MCRVRPGLDLLPRKDVILMPFYCLCINPIYALTTVAHLHTCKSPIQFVLMHPNNMADVCLLARFC